MKTLKQLLLLIFAFIFTINLAAQNCDLSSEAQKYWNRAMAASDAITSDDDYQLVANEFEKALQYAPRCSDIYYNLARTYAQIGLKQGDFAFNKAESYLRSYINLESNDKEAQSLADRIEFNKEKYQRDLTIKQQQKNEDSRNALKQLEGKWKCKDVYLFDEFEIIISSTNAQIIPKPQFENGKLECSYKKSNLTINDDGTYSFFIEAIYHLNEGNNLGRGNGPRSNDFTTYKNLIGTLEITNDGMLKCSHYDKSIRDVDNKTHRSYLIPDSYEYNNILYVNFYYKIY